MVQLKQRPLPLGKQELALALFVHFGRIRKKEKVEKYININHIDKTDIQINSLDSRSFPVLNSNY